MGGILGGGGGGSSETKTGFGALTPYLQQQFGNIGGAVAQYTDPNRPGVQQMFTPLPQTADETAAINQIRQGFTPTAQSLQQDVGMLMNPFDQFVIDDINRQAQGDFSILKQNASQTGQFGSNRQMLGANDVEQTRLGTIGKLRQDQYNQALGQVFNNLVPSRAQDAQGLLGVGNFQRGLDTQTRQAPINALQSGTSMIAPFLGGSVSSSNQNGQGLLGGLGQLASGIGTGYAAYQGLGALGGLLGLSDRRAKEKIVPLGEENGHKIYEFSYKGYPERYIGVMADEVPEEARIPVGQYWAVNYDMIGVNFRRVA